ncbi:exo-alpha-sialidase [Aerococcaceae bacterium zg-BR22]|uniref:sialidase domain-containing protein n=1 Tax=Aerococcaceae bacterium zg-1292 TaxID=2774330 RepID=UPI004064A880|nr:exo-alpha-sialidase [Aerococcaceae bacterium zg-BR22]
MSKQSKRLFEKQQRFSIRKLTVGTCSIVIGSLLFGTNLAHAEEVVPTETNPVTAMTQNEDTQDLNSQSDTVPAADADKTVATQTDNDKQNNSDVAAPTNDSQPTMKDSAEEKTDDNSAKISEENNTNKPSTDTDAGKDAETKTDTEIGKEAETKNDTEVDKDTKAEQNADADTQSSDEKYKYIDLEKSVTESKDPFAENKVIHHEKISVPKGGKVTTNEDLEKYKELQDATLYMELKAPDNLDGLQSLFNVSNSKENAEYFTMYSLNGTVGVEGRAVGTNQFYQSYTNAPLKLKAGELNSIAFTVEGGADPKVRVYVNGVLSSTKRGSAKFIKDMLSPDSVQFGLVPRSMNGNGYPPQPFEVKNFDVYNRALSPAEIAERSKLYQRDDLDPQYTKEHGGYLSSKTNVFESAFKGQRNKEGIMSYRIPALLVTDKGTIIAGTDERTDHYSDWGNINMVVKRSEDNGETWSSTIKMTDLRTNPNATDKNKGNPQLIDMVLVQDKNSETKRIFAVYDMIPEGQGAFSLRDNPYDAYHREGDKAYLKLFHSDGRVFTLRDGVVHDPDGNPTDYRVVTKSEQAPYSTLGDVYQNDKLLGNIYFTTKKTSPFTVSKNMYLWMSYSDDDGKTWSSPRDITPEVTKKDFFFHGVGPGAGLVLDNGRIVIPTYSTNNNNPGVNHFSSQSSRIIYSDDHGKTWHVGESVNDNRTVNGRQIHSSTFTNGREVATEASVVQLNNKDLLMFSRGARGKLQMFRSKDRGNTWEDGVTVFNDVNDSNVQLAALHTVQDGKEYIILTNANGSGRNNGYARLAEVQADGTLKWTAHKLIQQGKYAYNSLQQIGKDEFMALFEHSDTDYYDYTISARKFNFNLFKEKIKGVQDTVIEEIYRVSPGHVAIKYSNTVIASEHKLHTDNQSTLTFVAQHSPNTVIYSVDEKAWGSRITSADADGLVNASGSKVVLDNELSKQPFNVPAYLKAVLATHQVEDGVYTKESLNAYKEAVRQLLVASPETSYEDLAPLVKKASDAKAALESHKEYTTRDDIATTEGDAQDNSQALTQAFDKDLETIWHTKWDGSGFGKPATFTLKKPVTAEGIIVTPRQDNANNGRFKSGSFVVTDTSGQEHTFDFKDWPDNTETQRVKFDKPIEVASVKMNVSSTYGSSTANENKFVSAAEIALQLPVPEAETVDTNEYDSLAKSGRETLANTEHADLFDKTDALLARYKEHNVLTETAYQEVLDKVKEVLASIPQVPDKDEDASKPDEDTTPNPDGEQTPNKDGKVDSDNEQKPDEDAPDKDESETDEENKPEQPAPDEDDDSKTDGENKPDEEDTQTPDENTPNTDGEVKPDESTPDTDDKTEPDDDNKPEQPTPGEDGKTDTDEGTTPSPDEEHKPDGEQKPDADGDVKPDEEQKPDADGEAKPDEEQKPDADGDVKPDEEQKPDADGEVKPDEEQKPDTDGEAKPDEEQKPDADGDVKPDEEQKPDTDEKTTPKTYVDEATKVSVTLSGKDATKDLQLNVKPVATSILPGKLDEKLVGKVINLFDIYFTNKSGERVQITEPAVVTMPRETTKTVAGVYYVATTGLAESLPFKQLDDSVQFTATHFSYYALAYKAEEKVTPSEKPGTDTKPNTDNPGTDTKPNTDKPGTTAPDKVTPNETKPNTKPTAPSQKDESTMDTNVDDKDIKENDTKQSETSNKAEEEKTTDSTSSRTTQKQENSMSTQTLPETGEYDAHLIFGTAALSILIGLGLVADDGKKVRK